MHVRPVEARDVPAVAALHRLALPMDFITTLGDRFLEDVYYRSIPEEPTGFGAVAEAEGRLVGFCVGVHAGHWNEVLFRKAPLALFRGIAETLARGPEAILELAVVGRAVLGGAPPGVGAFSTELTSMAVAPEARGMGLACRLVTECLRTVETRGASSCWTKTRAANRAARLVFERCGLRLAGTRRTGLNVDAYYAFELARKP